MASRHTARDARTPGWYWSDNDLIDHFGPLIGAYGIAVYSALARYADRDGRSFPSYTKLAKQLHMSRTKVITTIKVLEDVGLITIDQRLDERGDPASNEYALVAMAQQSQEHAKGSTPHALPSTPHALQVVHQAYGGSTPHVSEEDSWNKTHDQPPPPTPSEPAGGGGGNDLTETERLLLDFTPPFSVAAAHEFRDLPPDVVRTELNAACAAGSGPGALVRRWRRVTPTLPQSTRGLTRDTYHPPAPLVSTDPDRMQRVLSKDSRHAS